MATLATGLPARFGRAGLTPAGFHQEVSPSHLRFLLFQTFPSAMTMSARVKPFLSALLHALKEERHFALVDGVAFPTVGSLVIVFRPGLSPTHASLRSQLRS